MKQIPLINEQLFKQHSPVTANTDITEFIPYIAIAQELHIEPLLGQKLINELQQQIATDTLTTANSKLILKLAPVLSFYSVYQALPFHWASIANKGVTIRESENSKGVNIGDLSQLRRWIKDDAEVLKQQLIAFLNTNASDFPLWTKENKCTSGSSNKSDSGFYFSRK